MTILTKEIRKDAGKYDSILSILFDSYIDSNIAIEDKSELELKIEVNLVQMSANVNHRCYEVYKEIYNSIRDEVNHNGG